MASTKHPVYVRTEDGRPLWLTDEVPADSFPDLKALLEDTPAYFGELEGRPAGVECQLEEVAPGRVGFVMVLALPDA